MKRYRTSAIEVQEYVGWTCDGCGLEAEHYGVEVVISVNAGEEQGRIDEYDYCDDCLLQRADALVAAGSRAPLVIGEDEPKEPEAES